MTTKLNEILKAWPSGTVALQFWLEQHQISRQLSQKYVQGGWIESIGHGAYKRSGDTVYWQGGVYAFQRQWQWPIHVGGKTALELLGQAHFIPMSEHRALYLYTHSPHPERQLPRWFTQHFSEQKFCYVSNVLFNSDLGLETMDCSTFKITLSSPERALLEVLALVPKKIDFEHAFLLFQGKETLRVDLIQELLQDCRSQTLKRLFLYLAKRCDLAWMERLNLQAIGLGQGKRKIGAGEHYDPEFKFFVPKLSIDQEEWGMPPR